MADVPYDSALIAKRADETVESPARRALRRLWRRKGAVVGLVVVALFVADRGLRAADLALRSGGAKLDRGAQGAVLARTGSAPTMSGATCWRA